MTVDAPFDAPADDGGNVPAEADAANFHRLNAAIRAELAALEAEDVAAIEVATADKLAALRAVHADVAAGVTPQRGLLEEAHALNAEAALRARAKMLSVERRLAVVQVVAGKPAALIYGRDGRWA